MNYDRNIMLMTWRSLNPGELTVEPRTIAEMDRDLFELYDEEIRRQSEPEGIQRNQKNRSLLVFFAVLSPHDDVRRQVRDAVTYFCHVNPL